MTIYSINKGIGWASSGVEFAQSYRGQIFRQLGLKSKFIFTDWISYENIEHLTRNMGFEDDEIIWLYTFFTDFKIAPVTYTTEKLEKHLPKIISKKRTGKIIRYDFGDGFWATAYLKDDKSNYVERVEYVSGQNLIRKDYFTYARYCTEFYAPFENRAKVYQRRFYNEDGTTVYDELLDGKNEPVFKFKDDIFSSVHGLISKMLRELHFTKNDVILIDRAEDQGQEILENRRHAKVGTIVHADHFSEPETNNDTILWNNFYEYEFEHYQDIDFYVTATKAQADLLRKQFIKYKNYDPKIFVIPVGNLNELKVVDFNSRKPFSIITASRLASEKHIDWAVRAVAKAHKKYPEITFDIYGSGSEENNIRNAINETHSKDYIHLMGHQDLEDVYKKYQVYLSCSTSEGFGLTLMEAVGSGLAMCGYNVRYGNQTFIVNNRNGSLIPYDSTLPIPKHIDDIAKGLEHVFESDLEKFSEKSYKIAKNYLSKKVAKLWKKALESEMS